MWPISPAAAAALTVSHQQAAISAVLISPAGDEAPVYVVGGQVVADRTQPALRHGTVVLVDTSPSGAATLIPTDPSHPLYPTSGWWCLIWWGIRLADGQVEQVPVGTFLMDEVVLTEDTDGITVTADLADLATSVSAQKWETMTLLDGSAAEVITATVTARLPTVAVELDGLDWPVPPQWRGGEHDDPWQISADIARGSGRSLRFSPVATLVSPPWADTGTTVPIVLTGLSRRLRAKEIANVVIVRTSAGAVPIQAVAEDDDPLSPTWVGGPLGRRPKWLPAPASEQVTSQSQADVAAQAELDQAKAVLDTVEATCVPHPAAEPGDLVLLDRLGMSGVGVIERITLPLDPAGSMLIEARRRQT